MRDSRATIIEFNDLTASLGLFLNLPKRSTSLLCLCATLCPLNFSSLFDLSSKREILTRTNKGLITKFHASVHCVYGPTCIAKLDLARQPEPDIIWTATLAQTGWQR
jgi:hypothetical protein